MEGISGEVREARCCRLIDISIKAETLMILALN